MSDRKERGLRVMLASAEDRIRELEAQLRGEAPGTEAYDAGYTDAWGEARTALEEAREANLILMLERDAAEAAVEAALASPMRSEAGLYICSSCRAELEDALAQREEEE